MERNRNPVIYFGLMVPALLWFSPLFAVTADSSQTKTLFQKETGNMDNDKLGGILEENGVILEGGNGFWQVRYLDRVITVITDEKNNRMRMITAVIRKKDIKKDQLIDLIEAQFDRALDVKYAFYDDILWSVFIHPLKELTEAQVVDALSQVYFAANNFGGSYKSTNLKFGTGDN